MRNNEWLGHALYQLQADIKRSSDTHLIKVEIPSARHVSLYLKDESTHPTGSLKHRLARSLFLYGLCNGQIHEGTTIVESSSGNTAISEAYFARMLGLPFVAVVPVGTSEKKIENINYYGGTCHFVDPQNIYSEAARLAEEINGHYMNQFEYAERATDWRGNNNIAESIFDQLEMEDPSTPDWIVCSAGTGGTSATIGRYIRYRGLPTRLCVADPEGSVFFDHYRTGDPNVVTHCRSRVEGIGRPRVEQSFIRTVIDRMIQVPDAATQGTLRFLESILNRRCGASTGTNLYAAFQIVAELSQQPDPATVVSIICDNGDRYEDTFYNEQWVRDNDIDGALFQKKLEHFFACGRWNADHQQKDSLRPDSSAFGEFQI